MSFTILNTYDNYIDANLHMMQLQEEGINCWLKDENTVTIDPLLTNAIGGIKLMVHETQKERAKDILRTIQNKAKEKRACPYCGSLNVEYIFTYLLGGYALAGEKLYHCFDCEKEFEEVKEAVLPTKEGPVEQ